MELWRYFPVSHIFCTNRDGWVLSDLGTYRVSGCFYEVPEMEADTAGGCERWALSPSFGRAGGRQVAEQGTGTVPKPGSWPSEVLAVS